MNNTLPYYEEELKFIQSMLADFGGRNPQAAANLRLVGGASTDPHIERLIHAFALLAGRVRRKLDDEFPEISESLLNLLYPHYLRPIPSMGIAQMRLDGGAAKVEVPKGTVLETRAIEGPGAEMKCTFRTCYPTTVWPLELIGAQITQAAGLMLGSKAEGAAAVVRLVLQSQERGLEISRIGPDSLRFCLTGEGRIPLTLYELIAGHATRALVTPSSDDSRIGVSELPPNPIRLVGFGRDEGVLPWRDSSFMGYRLLQEYLCFPGKFLFFDVVGLRDAVRTFPGERLEILLLVEDFELAQRAMELQSLIKADNFALGCTPIVNLFEIEAQPVSAARTATEHLVRPSVRNQDRYEVYSIDRVLSRPRWGEKAFEYRRFYSHTHSDAKSGEAFWLEHRRPRPELKDQDSSASYLATDVYLSLVNLDFELARPESDVIVPRITCSNRDLARKINLQAKYGDFTVAEFEQVQARTLPGNVLTPPLPPPLGKGRQWRLISHLSLNYLSLAGSSTGAPGEYRDPEELREILALYDFSDSPETRKKVAAIQKIRSRRRMSRLRLGEGPDAEIAFVLGMNIDVVLNEAPLENGAWLLGAVLDRFLGLYTAVNSFTQLTVKSSQRKEAIAVWPARAGEQVLI